MASQAKDLNSRTIHALLEGIRYKWFEVGLKLGIPHHQLSTFEKEKNPLLFVIEYWLQGNVEDTIISWETVVRVLKSSTIGESKLAERIRKIYCQQAHLVSVEKNVKEDFSHLTMQTEHYSQGSPVFWDKEWYHGELSRIDADRALTASGCNCFLIRMSEGNLILSLIHQGQIHHLIIKYGPGWYDLGCGAARYSLTELEELVLYYSLNEIEMLQIKLGVACQKTNIAESSIYKMAEELFLKKEEKTKTDYNKLVEDYREACKDRDEYRRQLKIAMSRQARRSEEIEHQNQSVSAFEKTEKRLSIDDTMHEISDEECLPMEPLQLHSSYPGVIFYGESVSEVLTSLEATVGDLDDIGISLFVPQNSLKLENEFSEIVIRPCFTGPFELPDGYKLASPVYLIHHKGKKFQKEVIVKMRHYANLQSDEDSNNLVFLFASCVPVIEQSGPRYVFKEMTAKGRFIQGSKIGEISSNHFSFETIARREGEGDDYSARLYWHDQQQSIIFCMCLDHPIYNKHCNNGMARKHFVQEPLVKTAKILKEDVEVHSNDSTGLYVKFLVTPSYIQRREIDAPKKFLDLADYPKKLKDLLNRLKDLVDYPPKIRAKINATPGFTPQLHVDGLDKECCFNLEDILASSQLESDRHIQEEAGHLHPLRRRTKQTITDTSKQPVTPAEKSYPVSNSSLCLALAICISVLVSTAFTYIALGGPLYSQNIEDKFLEKRTSTERNAHVSHSLDCHTIKDSKVLENYLKEITTKRDILCERLELRNCIELKLNDELEPFYLARSYINHQSDACWEDIVSKLCEMDLLRLAKTVAIEQDIFYYYTHHCLSAKE